MQWVGLVLEAEGLSTDMGFFMVFLDRRLITIAGMWKKWSMFEWALVTAVTHLIVSTAPTFYS